MIGFKFQIVEYRVIGDWFLLCGSRIVIVDRFVLYGSRIGIGN